MPKKQKKNKKPSQRWKHYVIKDGKLIRKNKFSPKEGPGIFMAIHKNRTTCGKSNYTEFKKSEENK
jgi:ubiquitin-small subunit ribosomal protein S27Ae